MIDHQKRVNVHHTFCCLLFYSAQVFPGKLSLQGETFKPEMKDRNSKVFKDQAKKIEDAVGSELRKLISPQTCSVFFPSILFWCELRDL